MDMNPYQLRVCFELNNVVWLCDACLFSFRKQRSAKRNDESSCVERDDKKHEIEHTVHQLQTEFVTMKQCFVELQQSLNSQSANNNPAIPSTSTPKSTPQTNFSRERTVSQHFNDSSQLRMGSNAETTSTGSRKFWLFFTRVAKHVSPDAIREMVSHSLRLNDQPEVVRLVPRWSNIENLRYVSFKVGVDWQYKDQAVKESTWPSGLLFREFEHRESSYWEP